MNKLSKRKKRLADLFLISSALLQGSISTLIWKNHTDPAGPRYALPDKFGKDLSAKKKYKAVTFNIHHGRKIDKALTMLREDPDLKGADFIMLQERDHHEVKHIAEALGMNFVYYPAAFNRTTGRDFGNAILSKYPIVRDEKHVLHASHIEDLQRVATVAVTDTGREKIALISLHQGVLLWSDERSQQIANLLELIEPDMPAIIAGDFNTYNKKQLRAIQTVMRKYDLQNATGDVRWTYILRPLFYKRVKLDHIFARDFQTQDSGRIKDLKSSDHLPVWADLRLD